MMRSIWSSRVGRFEKWDLQNSREYWIIQIGEELTKRSKQLSGLNVRRKRLHDIHAGATVLMSKSIKTPE